MAHIETNFFSSAATIDLLFDIFIFVAVVTFVAICIYAAGKASDDKQKEK